MEHRTLEINVMSGKDLNKVNFITKMDVYVVVSISGSSDKSKQKAKTAVDKDGDSNPTWNFPMKFSIDEAAAQQNRLTLDFKIMCERALGDKEIGEVHVPIKELLDTPGAIDGQQQVVNYQVRKPNGKGKGFISFSYKLGEKIAKINEPVTAYPAPNHNSVGPSSVYPPPGVAAPPAVMASGPYPPPHHQEGGYSYPPPPPHHSGPPPPHHGGPPPPGGYPPPHPAGYGYPQPPPYGGYPPPPQPGYGYPPQPGYGYPPVQQQQPPKKNKFGMGLGAGLLGGALGGLLIGDMISDAGAYDAGYDAGFGDAGFDF